MFRINYFEICKATQIFVEPFKSPKSLKNEPTYLTFNTRERKSKFFC